MAYFRAGTARATHEAQQIARAREAVAEFTGNVNGLYLAEVIAYIKAQQAGSGTPSPINPRTFSGISSVTITNNDGQTPPVEEYTATTALGMTCYGGMLNVTTGLLTITHGIVDLTGKSYTTTSWGAYRTAAPTDCKYVNSNIVPDAMAEKYNITTYQNLNGNKPNNHLAIGGSSSNVYIYVIADSTPTGLLVYELKPENVQTYQLTPAQLEQIINNHISADSGDVAVKYWRID